MLLNKLLKISALLLISLFLFTPISFAGFNRSNTDAVDSLLFYFFDLRDRESFIQLTNADFENVIVHVQIFDVSNNCNENNFFDAYTGNDTHVYDLRNILTNDNNPSGVVLPDGAYGIVAIGVIDSASGGFDSGNFTLTGNLRIIDNSGFEYRSNAQGVANTNSTDLNHITFNFDTSNEITFSDIVGISFFRDIPSGEVLLSDITENFYVANIDILNQNEVIFSCRNVIFACTDQDNPLLEALLEEAGEASVASFEYGINNAIPHSKGGELLCPGNNINQGFVNIDRLGSGPGNLTFIGFIGLNNGNGRGTLDSFWYPNNVVSSW